MGKLENEPLFSMHPNQNPLKKTHEKTDDYVVGRAPKSAEASSEVTESCTARKCTALTEKWFFPTRSLPQNGSEQTARLFATVRGRILSEIDQSDRLQHHRMPYDSLTECYLRSSKCTMFIVTLARHLACILLEVQREDKTLTSRKVVTRRHTISAEPSAFLEP